MLSINNRWIMIGALSAALAVVIGAFGAHALRARLLSLDNEPAIELLEADEAPRQTPLEVFDTAAEYHRTHALALVATGIIVCLRPRRSLTFAAWCFLLGTIVFSGSLYALAITGIRWLGAITPVGGALFIVGWIAFAVGSCAGSSSET